MPEVFYDDTNWELYKQCELRRPAENGYYFDIVWIPADLARKGKQIVDARGNTWMVHEVYGSKKMPQAQKDYKAGMG